MAKCPSCQMEVDANASLCPHCKQIILSFDKGKNAIAKLVGGIILFLILYKVFNWWVHREADIEMEKINEKYHFDGR